MTRRKLTDPEARQLKDYAACQVNRALEHLTTAICEGRDGSTYELAARFLGVLSNESFAKNAEVDVRLSPNDLLGRVTLEFLVASIDQCGGGADVMPLPYLLGPPATALLREQSVSLFLAALSVAIGQMKVKGREAKMRPAPQGKM